MVMARPLKAKEEGPLFASEVTFLAEDTLQQLFPVESKVEVVNLTRVTDFFLGLNAAAGSPYE